MRRGRWLVVEHVRRRRCTGEAEAVHAAARLRGGRTLALKRLEAAAAPLRRLEPLESRQLERLGAEPFGGRAQLGALRWVELEGEARKGRGTCLLQE